MFDSMRLPEGLVEIPWVANPDGWLRILERSNLWSRLKGDAACHYTGEDVVRYAGGNKGLAEDQFDRIRYHLYIGILRRLDGVAFNRMRKVIATLRPKIGRAHV